MVIFHSYVSLPEGISYGRDAIFFLLCHLLGDLLALHRFNLRFLGLTKSGATGSQSVGISGGGLFIICFTWAPYIGLSDNHLVEISPVASLYDSSFYPVELDSVLYNIGTSPSCSIDCWTYVDLSSLSLGSSATNY